jgi:two-component system sensor histidine kinase DesK
MKSIGTGSRKLLWLIWVVWLPFLLPPIFTLISEKPSFIYFAVILAINGVFAALYLWATRRNGFVLAGSHDFTALSLTARWVVIAAMIILATLLALVGGNSTWMSPFIFCSAYIAGALPAKKAGLAIGGLVGLTFLTVRLISSNWIDLGSPLVYVIVVGIVVMSFRQSILANIELVAARAEIAELAVSNERLRIARDLHDLLGHNLSLITLKSELANRLIHSDPDQAAREIADVEHTARKTLQEVREAVASYRQSTLESELQAAKEILSAAGIDYQVVGRESLGILPARVEAALSWTVREGVTNIIRHSHARLSTIQFNRGKESAGLTITNDGVAIESEKEFSSGLNGLSERVKALSGLLEASALPEGGFRLEVTLPITLKEEKP